MTNENERAALVKAKFASWCKPRRGTQNPEIQTNRVWAEIIDKKLSPYKAHKIYGIGEKQSPGWTYERYGQSETILPDGTVISIGGEHEDFYDPDFYIYNDVIVQDSDGQITIYGYPEVNFPPTDSHSATLVGEDIYIIGCIGYPKQRNYEDTPVYILDLKDYSIRKFQTSGTPPNWLYKHEAKFVPQENAIYCDDGMIQDIKNEECVENIKTWRLCLRTGVWSCTATKPWTRWRLLREDNKPNNLYEIGQVASAERRGRKDKYYEAYKNDLQKKNYPLDIAAYEARYVPPLKHKIIPDDEYKRHTISINDVIIRYDENGWHITVTVQGVLPDTTIKVLKAHGLTTFSMLEATPYKIKEL